MDNILLDPHNSSHRSTSQPHSIIAKYTGYQTGFIYHYYYSFKICRRLYSVEALVSGYHPRDAKKVPVTGAGGRLQEWKNREFVWELRKTCFFVKATVGRAIRLRECSLEELPLYFSRNFSSKLSGVLYT